MNNAGIFPFGPIDDVTVEEIDRTLGIHARAVFLASQAAVRHMSAGGRIISIGSNLAERVPFPGVTLYSMSKAALIGFTKALARDLGDRDITVNLVQPGSTDTDMNPADAAGADEQRALSRSVGTPTPAMSRTRWRSWRVPARRISPARCSPSTAARTRNDAWLILVCAGLLEIVWATALKQSRGSPGCGRASSVSVVRC